MKVEGDTSQMKEDMFKA